MKEGGLGTLGMDVRMGPRDRGQRPGPGCDAGRGASRQGGLQAGPPTGREAYRQGRLQAGRPTGRAYRL